MLLTLLGASVLIWGLLPLAPGAPALRTLQALGIENPREAEVQAMRRDLHLDRSLPAQYFSWLRRALGGDLSVSWQSGQPVLQELGKRWPATVRLAFVTLLLAMALTFALALANVAFPERWPDRAVKLITQLGAWLGGVAIIEVVFTWPGLGSYVVAAIAARDLPVIQGFVMVSTLMFVAATFLADVVSACKPPNTAAINKPSKAVGQVNSFTAASGGCVAESERRQARQTLHDASSPKDYAKTLCKMNGLQLPTVDFGFGCTRALKMANAFGFTGGLSAAASIICLLVAAEHYVRAH